MFCYVMQRNGNFTAAAMIFCDKINAFFQYITQYYINNPLLLSIFNNIVKKANATREFFADIL